MKTPVSDSHTIFYIPGIQNLAFNLTHMRILGRSHCVEMRRPAFKRRGLFQYILCYRDYAEIVVTSFSNQIQS